MCAQWDNTESTQALQNRSFNTTYQLLEFLAYEAKGNGTIGAISAEKPDVTYTWTDGYPTQKVEVYSDRTVTTDFTWVTGELTEKDVTVT